MPLRLQATAPVGQKQDTLFLGDSSSGTWSELVVDDSQFFDDFTEASVGQGGSTTDARFQFSGEFTIGYHCELDNGATGFIWSVRRTSFETMIVEFDGSGNVTVTVNDTTALSATAVTTVGGSPEEHIVAWASRANPGTTGASDARQSWLYFHNLATGDTQRIEFTHAAISYSSDRHYIGTGADGSAADDFSEVIYQIFIGRRCQTFTEIARDWIETVDTDLVFWPDMNTLVDRVSGNVGANTDTEYYANKDARVFPGGTSDRVQWVTPQDLTGSAFTFAAWIYADSIASSEAVFVVGSSATGDAYQIRFDGSDRLQFIHVRDGGGTSRNVVTTAAIPTGQWVHVCVAADSSDLASGVDIYIDGVEGTYSTATNGSGGTERDPDEHYVLGNTTIGTQPFDGQIRDARVWDRQLSATEVLEVVTGPLTDCEIERPPLPLDQASGLGDENEFYGPVPAWAAKVAAHMRRRTFTPLVNRVFLSQSDLRNISHTDQPGWRYAPGTSDYLMMLGWLQVARVPPGADRLRVRMNTRTWVTSGGSVPMGFRVYVMPWPLSQNLEYYYTHELVDRDDGSSTATGEWNADGVIPVPDSPSGLVLLCPAYAFDPESASANDANARLNVRALQAIPCKSGADGGLPSGDIGGIIGG